MNKKFYALLLIICLFGLTCAKSYEKILQNTEQYFQKGEYQAAVDEIRDLVNDAGNRNRLLLLMEAAVILHTMGEYKNSNKALDDAISLADSIKKSVSKQVLAFITSDRQQNYTGENFERVLLKFYLALNYISLGDYEAAKRSFRKLDYDLKEMKYEDMPYKQNLAARYLDAIISESLGKYNDARVQYKNIEMLDKNNSIIRPSRYVLAVKENDAGDIQRYGNSKKSIPAFNKKMQPEDYTPNMGELVIIHQAGHAPVKSSRGRLLDDQQFMVALRAALIVAINTEGAPVSVAGVLSMLGTAENPIPVYKERDPVGAREIRVIINDKTVAKTKTMNDYKLTAINNFNEQYAGMITRNVASIATKFVLAAVAAHEISKKAEEASDGNPFVGTVGRFLIGAGAGATVAATVKPDLRCWRLLPANFQISRIFLEPGKYKIDFKFNQANVLTSKYKKSVVIKSGQPTFINLRSMSK